MKRFTLFVIVAVLFAAAAITLFARGAGEPQAVAEQQTVADEPTGLTATELMRRLTSIGSTTAGVAGREVPIVLPPEYQGQDPPGGYTQFSTDFSRALISYTDVVAGGPPKDGIPAIDRPQFVSVAEGNRWLAANEPVIVVTVGDAVRVYPLQILMWHEIVNDEVGDTALAITYCPLCNTGIVFDRRFEDRVFDFGVSGRLVYSNMIMYDRQTETWWIQATGRGIAGRYAGQQLRLYPSMMLSWREAADAYPDARVLSRETGFRRDYGRNPYVGYDQAAVPFLYRGPDVIDRGSEHAMTRVLGVYHGDGVTAIDFPSLQSDRVVTRTIDGTEVVVFWAPQTASALDAPEVSGGRDVGTANAFYPVIDGRTLGFAVLDDRIVDSDTGSVWTVSGRAISGPLAGLTLQPALSVHHFLFSWRAFHPASQ